VHTEAHGTVIVEVVSCSGRREARLDGGVRVMTLRTGVQPGYD